MLNKNKNKTKQKLNVTAEFSSSLFCRVTALIFRLIFSPKEIKNVRIKIQNDFKAEKPLEYIYSLSEIA